MNIDDDHFSLFQQGLEEDEGGTDGDEDGLEGGLEEMTTEPE